MTLRSLTLPTEAKMISAMRKRMSVIGTRKYVDYLRTDGLEVNNVTSFETAVSLWRKGWLRDEPDLLKTTHVYFSLDAWRRFCTDEWDAIEEQTTNKQRSDKYGSWS